MYEQYSPCAYPHILNCHNCVVCNNCNLACKVTYDGVLNLPENELLTALNVKKKIVFNRLYGMSKEV